MRNRVLGILLIIGTSCGNDNDYIIETNESNLKSLLVEVDTIRIQLDSVSLKSYDEVNYINSNGVGYIVSLNKLRNSIDIFDTSKQQITKHISIEDNKGLLGEIRGFYAFDFNNMVIITPGKLVFFDSNGVINDYVDFYKLNGYDYSKLGEPAITPQFPLNISFFNGSPTMLFYSYREAKEYINHDAVLQYETTTKKLNVLPIQYSDYFKDNEGKLGFLAYLNLGHVSKDYIVYNFVYESNVYRYNRVTQKTELFGGKINDVDPLAKVFEDGGVDDEMSNHAIENPHYFRLLYDQQNKLYYRPVWKQIKYRQGGNYFNSFIDKELIVSIFDEKLNLVGNHYLPKNTYAIHRWFMSDKGLVLSPTHPNSKFSDEDVLEFHIYRFK